MTPAGEQALHPQLRFARFLPRTVITSRTLPALRVLTRFAGMFRRPGGQVVSVDADVSVRVFRPASEPGAVVDPRRRHGAR